ncbi:MAG: sensor histidine kinase [Rhodoglobus sp.]
MTEAARVGTGSRGIEPGVGIGQAERSGRQMLAIYSALLMVVVISVHLGFVARGEHSVYPEWAVRLSWFAASATLALGVGARWVSDRLLWAMALVAVAAYGATLVTFPVAVPDTGIDRIPWTLSSSSAAAAAALVVGGRGLAWITVCMGAIAGLGYRALYGGLDLSGVVNDLQALLTGTLICVIGGQILLVARGLDHATTAKSEAAARESALRGRLAARTRAAALVHDEVLSTLTLAASDLPVPRARLADQARSAAAMVSRLAEESVDEPVALRESLVELARQYGAVLVSHGALGPTPEQATCEALLGAARQALRNSLQHAPLARRELVLEQRDGVIIVQIRDDGPGFDPERVADDRLGIRQSIIGRMARVQGGRAVVESAPGRGTVIHLEIDTVTVTQPDPTVEPDALRKGVNAVSIVFLLTQLVLAALATLTAPSTWPLQLGMLATAIAAGEILRRAQGRVPSRTSTTLVIVLAMAGLLVGTVAGRIVYDLPFSYGTMWFAGAFAFLFVALVIRLRIVTALIGAACAVAVLVVGGLASGSTALSIVPVTSRFVVVVALAAALMVAVQRMQRRITALHQDTVASVERASWTDGARSELTGRVAELARTVVPLLDRIAARGEITDAERREYARAEGELRDSLRAGALTREPLSSAVAAARGRGVDVLLLDDGDGEVDDLLVEPILNWMADGVATAQVRAVGRLLPRGRDAQVSLTIDGQQVEFTAR